MVGSLCFCLASTNGIFFSNSAILFVYFCIENVLTCSFDQPCSWSGFETWKKSSHMVDDSSFFEGKIWLSCNFLPNQSLL